MTLLAQLLPNEAICGEEKVREMGVHVRIPFIPESVAWKMQLAFEEKNHAKGGSTAKTGARSSTERATVVGVGE